MRNASLASTDTSRAWMLGLPFVAFLAFAVLDLFPMVWFLVLVVMTGIAVAGLRKPSIEMYDSYRRLAGLGVAWMSAFFVYLGLALAQ